MSKKPKDTKRKFDDTPSQGDILAGAGVAVLIPAYNEASTVGKVVADFARVLPKAQIFVYDNNSEDETSDRARSAGAVVRHEGRQGKGLVVRQMFRDIDARFYILVDADDTYPADACAALLEPLAAGEADMVVGDRITSGAYGRENTRAFHGFGNKLVCALINWLFKCDYKDVMSGYRAFTRQFVKTMPVMSTNFQVETELSIHAANLKWRVVEIPIDYRERHEGSVSKLDTRSDGIAVISAIFSLFKDYRPFAFFGWIAAFFVLIGLALGLPVVYEFTQTGFVERFPTAILAVALVMCGGISFAIGLILDTIAKNSQKLWELLLLRL